MIIVENESDCDELFELLMCAPNIYGIDCETVGIDPRKQNPVGNGRIVCWSIAWLDYDEGVQRAFLWANSLDYFASWLASPDVHKVGHNIHGFDYHMFANMGYWLTGIVADTQHMSKLAFNHPQAKHGLKPLAESILDYDMDKFAELFSRPARLTVKTHAETKVRKRGGRNVLVCAGEEHTFSHKTTELIPLDRIREDYPDRLPALYDYASLDAKCTLELYLHFKKKLYDLST